MMARPASVWDADMKQKYFITCTIFQVYDQKIVLPNSIGTGENKISYVLHFSFHNINFQDLYLHEMYLHE